MLFEYTLYIVFAIISIAFVLALYRFIAGPDLTDRVVALDLISMIIIAFILVYMIFAEEPVYMDAVVITALISFFGTVAFARYLARGISK